MLRVVAVAALGFGPGAALASDGYPALVPLEGLLEAAGGGRLEAGGAEALSARAARLTARAERLRGIAPVDAETRARLAAVRGAADVPD